MVEHEDGEVTMPSYVYACPRHKRYRMTIMRPVSDRDCLPKCPMCGGKMRRELAVTVFGNATAVKAKREAGK